jgi:ABC-2 type transport system permease protein
MAAATVAMPVMILLLFDGVLGGTLGAGLGGGHGSYIDYVTPGILLMTVASGCMVTAVAVCTDMTTGIIDRFRSMPISQSALLTGHAAPSVIQTAISTVLVVAVALVRGLRP